MTVVYITNNMYYHHYRLYLYRNLSHWNFEFGLKKWIVFKSF